MRPCATTWDAEMSAAEHGLLCRLLSEGDWHDRHLEVGTAAGGTLAAMMNCYEPGKRPQFVVVDPMAYFPDQPAIVRQNLTRHGLTADDVDFRVGTTVELLPAAESARQTFDFMLIDGCHRLSWVMQDLKWTRLLNVGGVVCLHDYAPKHQGVVCAVDRFLARHPHYSEIARADSLIAIRKDREAPQLEVGWSDEWYARLRSVPLAIERKWNRLKRNAA